TKTWENAVNYTVSGEALMRIRRDVERYGRQLGIAIDAELDWKRLQQFSMLSDHSILEGETTSILSFRHKGWLEFFFGLFLAKYADPAAVAVLDWKSFPRLQYTDGDSPRFRGIKPRDFTPADYSSTEEMERSIFGSVLRQVINADAWYWSWRFACEMPLFAVDPPWHPARLSESLAVLFDRPPCGPRPTELMYRAWAMFQRQPGLSDEWQGILSEYRQQFLDILGGEELDQAQRAAEVLWEEDVRQLVAEGKTGKWTFEQLRRDADEHPAYALCCDKYDPDHLTFMMGASPQDKSAYKYEKPWQKAQTDAFFMATCCITRDQYRLFDPQRERLHQDSVYGFSNIAPDEDCPMIYVSWFDSFCFALWLGEKYRLPSEIEWEGAAWGGIDRQSIEHQETVIGIPPFASTFTTDSVNFDGNHPVSGEKSTYLGRTLPVKWDENRRKAAIEADSPAAQLPHYFPNDFGLWHMNGNVWEWCRSGWIEDLTALIAAADGDYADAFVQNRSIRGGSWGSVAGSTRTSDRFRFEPGFRDGITGFRLSRTR
ncbi:MAG: formylglycine-generating enzyme family protein, partial [Planctomycetaceae bacterium]|nr:formylglycine-generating enzyme family protein [Planctomycetaceae bacterium]